MKIALVVPNPSVALASDCSPPLGLAHVASYLRLQGLAEVQIFDGFANQDVRREIADFCPDVVGITATTPQIPDAYLLADSLKRKGITVVFGGPHATVLPEEVLDHAHLVVVGEGEVAFAKIVRKLRDDEPIDNRIIQGEPVENLDTLPPPAFDLLNMPFYLSRNFLEQVMPAPILGLVTSRGCPVKPACVFCYNGWRTGKVRYFSAKRVAQDITDLHTVYGVSRFFFQDDEFLINKKRLTEIAEIFRNQGIDRWIEWGCQARVTSITKDVLDLAESAGCKLIVPGFESHNERILKYLKNSSVSIQDIDHAVSLFRKRKIMLGGNFVYGSPTETLAEMKENFQFYLDTPQLTFMNANVLTPYPGTQAWKDCDMPEGFDYSKLLPTDELGNQFNFSAVPNVEFADFMRDLRRIRRVVSLVRFGQGWSLVKKKVFYWMLLRYPKITINLISERLRTEERTKSFWAAFDSVFAKLEGSLPLDNEGVKLL